MKLPNTLHVTTRRISFLSLKQYLTYPMHDHGILRNIFFWLSTTEGKNIVKLLAISKTCQFQLFLTDLPPNF